MRISTIILPISFATTLLSCRTTEPTSSTVTAASKKPSPKSKPSVATPSKDARLIAAQILIGNDLEALVGDTVNEGSVEAELHRTDTDGAVNCEWSSPSNNQGFRPVRCAIEFLVTFNENEFGSDVKPVTRECRVPYLVSTSDPLRVKRGPKIEFDPCLEILSDGPF